MNVFHEFHARASFIALIPKKTGKVDIKDFLPISRASNIYKIIYKFIVKRLKAVLEKVISRSQNAFISGR